MKTPTSTQIVLPALMLLAHESGGTFSADVFEAVYNAARIVFPVVCIDRSAASIVEDDPLIRNSVTLGDWHRDNIGSGEMFFNSDGWSIVMPQDIESVSAKGKFVAVAAMIINIRFTIALKTKHFAEEIANLNSYIREQLAKLNIDSKDIFLQKLKVAESSMQRVLCAVQFDAEQRKQALETYLEERKVNPNLVVPYENL